MIVELVGLPGAGKTTLARMAKKNMEEADHLVIREDLHARSIDFLIDHGARGKGKSSHLIRLVNLLFKMKNRYGLCDYARVEKAIRQSVFKEMVSGHYNLAAHAAFLRQMDKVKEISQEIYDQRIQVLADMIYLTSYISEDDFVFLDEGLFQRMVATLALIKQYDNDTCFDGVWEASQSNFVIFLDVDPEVALERHMKRNKRLAVAEMKGQEDFFHTMRKEIINQLGMIPENMKRIISGADVDCCPREMLYQARNTRFPLFRPSDIYR